MVNWLSLLLNSTSSQVRSMPHLFFCPFVKNTLRTEDTSQNPNLNLTPHLIFLAQNPWISSQIYNKAFQNTTTIVTFLVKTHHPV
ncbi:hypothetical protein HanIR_Chr05g0214541 [Helianthus annuus]|nr:hypothetical protein HanIR_Chr05g0214541 [Helianthus annuus]